MTGVAYATVTTIEGFEALSTGSLGGQGGWTTLSGAAGDLTVENTVYYQGTQAAYHTDTATAAPWADKKAVTGVTSGIFGAYMMINTDRPYMDFQLRSSAAPSTRIGGAYTLTTNNKLTFQVRSHTATLVTTVSLGTWYHVEYEINQVAEQMRARVDGGAWTSWLDEASGGTIDTVVILGGSDNTGGNFHFDYITYDDGSDRAFHRE